jgi:acyl transferase domain-containing protein
VGLVVDGAGFDAKAPARLAIVAETEAELDARLGEALDRIAKDPSSPFSLPTGVHYGVGPSEGPVAFLFPGQGSQYIDMTAALAMQDERALEAWDRAADLDVFGGDGAARRRVPASRVRRRGEAALDAKLTSTEWAQPAIGASSLSLLHVLKALGVTPSAVGGHSFGEVMALHAPA